MPWSCVVVGVFWFARIDDPSALCAVLAIQFRPCGPKSLSVALACPAYAGSSSEFGFAPECSS